MKIFRISGKFKSFHGPHVGHTCFFSSWSNPLCLFLWLTQVLNLSILLIYFLWRFLYSVIFCSYYIFHLSKGWSFSYPISRMHTHKYAQEQYILLTKKLLFNKIITSIAKYTCDVIKTKRLQQTCKRRGSDYRCRSARRCVVLRRWCRWRHAIVTLMTSRVVRTLIWWTRDDRDLGSISSTF